MSGALFDHLWQSTLFGLAIWGSTLLLRGNSAAVRHWLWLLASVKFLLPFSLLYGIGAAIGITPAVEVPTDYIAALSVAAPVMSPSVLDVGQPASSSMLAPVLVGVWLIVSATLALRWFHGWRLAVRLSASTRPSSQGPADVRLIDADIEPSVARVFQPVVLLPAALPEKLSAPQLDALLEHEREHIERHDNLKAHLQRMVETLFWFHPLVWIIGRQLVDERERACDEAVLARGHDAGEYAAGILAVCRHCRSHSPHAMAAVSGDLTTRVRQILGGGAPVSLGFIKAFALTLGSLLVAAAPLLAGALEGSAQRREIVAANDGLLRNAQIEVREANGNDASMSVAASGREIAIRNSSLRELIAQAYEVSSWEVRGGEWLDVPRYDLVARTSEDLREAEDFDPAALRAMVNRLLAERFALEIHVNQQCQEPCGPRALRVAAR